MNHLRVEFIKLGELGRHGWVAFSKLFYAYVLGFVIRKTHVAICAKKGVFGLL